MIRSDYLDTSNTYRLIAFFQFCDVANKAVTSIGSLNIADPVAKKCAIGVISAMRYQALERALDLFDPYIPHGNLTS